MPAEGKGKVGILRPYKQGLLALGMRTEGQEMERLSQQVRYQEEDTEKSKGLEGVRWGTCYIRHTWGVHRDATQTAGSSVRAQAALGIPRRLRVRLLMGVSLGNAQTKPEADQSRSRCLGASQELPEQRKKEKPRSNRKLQSKRAEEALGASGSIKEERTTVLRQGTKTSSWDRHGCGVGKGGHSACLGHI